MHVSRSRRAFLEAALRGAGFALAARSGLVDLVAQGSSPARRLIIHSARPQDLETPVHLLTSWITPNDLFYIRSHFYTPAVREETWRLQIDGEVATPLTLTMDALMRLPAKTMPVTLECAGNGRGYYDPPVAGVPWRKGAVGTARWTVLRGGASGVRRCGGGRPSTRGRVWWGPLARPSPYTNCAVCLRPAFVN